MPPKTAKGFARSQPNAFSLRFHGHNVDRDVMVRSALRCKLDKPASEMKVLAVEA